MTATPKALWGVQPGGFYCPTIEDILADESADLRAVVSPIIDLDPDSPEGQTAGIRARQYALAWEALQVIHDANNPVNAEADLLDDVCKLSGTARPGATSTTVVAQCALTSGTTLANGTAFASVTGRPDVLLTPAEDYTAPGNGTFDVTFACVDTGPIVVAAGSLAISAPISGWASVTNAAAGVTGHDVFDDSTLRVLRESELARTGNSTILALAADIQALTGVKSVTVLENTGATTDGHGLPSHTIAPIVQGTPVAADLAAAIWQGKAEGVGTYGSTSISFVDSTGTTRTVNYTPVVPIPMYLTYALTTGTGYIGDTAAADALAVALTALVAPGGTVFALKAEAAALALGGVTDVTAFHLGTAPAPTGTSNITIGPFAVATFDAANIGVTS